MMLYAYSFEKFVNRVELTMKTSCVRPQRPALNPHRIPLGLCKT
jgi:hypothetical protein